MTHIHGFGPVLLRGRVLVGGALASLVLAGCGSDQSGSNAQDMPGASAAKSSPAALSAEQAAFAAMLDRVARPCPAHGESPVGGKPSRPQEEQRLAPGETPPAAPIEPGVLPGPEWILDARDWCASVQHEQRIIEALQKVPAPNPLKVRKALNSLGYIDERIHGLAQEGRTTRFHLDLRDEGGQLCEEGTAAGETTDVTPCAAPATGAFTVEGN